MTPARPALDHAAVAEPLGDVPDYVRQLLKEASYLPDDQRMRLRRAWEVGAQAHAGQTRKSGEPYITHPVAVAKVLAEQGLDPLPVTQPWSRHSRISAGPSRVSRCE